MILRVRLAGDQNWAMVSVMLGSRFGACTNAVFVLGTFLPLLALGATADRVVLVTIDGLAAFYLSDPAAPLPTLRRMAAEGAMAEGVRVANPSTTWPNHTSLITGVYPDEHSVLFNGLLVRGGPGQPVEIVGERNQSELVAVPTLYDRLHQLGYRTAAINWPCTRGATALDDNFPDTPDRMSQVTPRLRAELVQAGILEASPTEAGFESKSAAGADQAWTAAAVHLLNRRPPNLLLLHLLVTDAIQHRYGPESPAAYTALALADARVAELLQAVKAADPRERVTVVVASDHGFEKPLKLINPNVVLRQAGMMRPGPHRRAQSVSSGGTAFIYLTNPSSAKEDRARVINLLRPLEGVAEILDPRQYLAWHLPDPARNSQIGDLLLVAKDGYTFSEEVFEDNPITPIPVSLGSHGYPATDPRMNGVFVAWGPQIKPGTKLGLVDIVDVAPTIAAFLGESFPEAKGKVLRKLLRDSRRTPESQSEKNHR